MEKKKNGCKAFLISKSKILRSVVTLLLLVSFLFLDVVRVAAASTLEEEAEISDNSQSGLNITDDDFANGNLLYVHNLSYNDGAVVRDYGYPHTVFMNGITDVFHWTVDASSNVNFDRTKMMRSRFKFSLADGTKMMSKGSDFTFSLSGLYNGVSVYNLDDGLVASDYLGSSSSLDGCYVSITLYDIDGNTNASYRVPLTRTNLEYKEFGFDFDFEDIPYDVYSMVILVNYSPSTALKNVASFMGSDNYYLVLDSGLIDSSISITESLYSETDEKLDAINDNLDDIWARLVAIYDMVEDGFSAIVILFYDLMDFLDAEFDALSQTIVTQAGETRNTIVTQFTNLTNKLSTWFTNLTNTITTQFSTLTSNLNTWYIGMKNHIYQNFQDLLNQNKNEHEETINGYDSISGNIENDGVQSSINDYNNSQGEIMDDMNENMDDFTLPSDGLIGYAMQFTTTFPLVAGMMQSVFDSSGQLGLILSVVFAMTIFAMLVGLFKYYND